MKKIFTLLAAIVSTFSMMATTFSFSSSTESQTIDGITVSLSKGEGNNAPAVYSNHVRLYAENTINVSGADIKSVSLSFTKQGAKDYADLSASTGSLVSGGVSTSNDDVKTDTWTGNTTSVTFTLGETGQRIVLQIVVNGDGSETTPGGGDSGNNGGGSTDSGELDPGYAYAEPTVIKTPGNTVQGEAYSFVTNNIKVSCTKGAVNADYFSAHAGFAMTFTATKAIKGVVINGFVKANFEATVDHGSISYISPSADREANPVAVITDVNSTSVTISCVKQLRCYSVEFYFEENPEATVGGGSTGGSGDQTLVFDSADAVYESEYSEMFGEPNYSVFLYNAASPDFPYIALDLWPLEKGNLVGTYSFDDWTLDYYTYYAWGEGEYDAAWAEDGQVTITKSGDTYKIEGYILCDDNVTYTFSFSGKVDFYTDDEYYYGEGDEGGVEDVIAGEAAEGDSPAYDITGRPVDANYRGLVIKKGRKYMQR